MARFVGSDNPENLKSAVGEIEMIAEPKRKPHQNDDDRDKRERKHQEKALDEALKNTFPASDPVSVEQPRPPPTATGRRPEDLRMTNGRAVPSSFLSTPTSWIRVQSMLPDDR